MGDLLWGTFFGCPWSPPPLASEVLVPEPGHPGPGPQPQTHASLGSQECRPPAPRISGFWRRAPRAVWSGWRGGAPWPPAPHHGCIEAAESLSPEEALGSWFQRPPTVRWGCQGLRLDSSCVFRHKRRRESALLSRSYLFSGWCLRLRQLRPRSLLPPPFVLWPRGREAEVEGGVSLFSALLPPAGNSIR